MSATLTDQTARRDDPLVRRRARELAGLARRWRRRARRIARRAKVAARPAPPAVEQQAPPVPATPVRRSEPAPPMRPFPAARYVFVVGAIRSNFGGRTASILNKARLFSELAGVESTIVTLNYSADLDDVPADMRRRGLLVDGVRIVNLLDYFDAVSGPPLAPVHHEVDEPGMQTIRDAEEGVYAYLEDGSYRLVKRFDSQGRLNVRDWYNDNRAHTRRDEFGPTGHIRRTVYFDLRHDLPRQEVYFRPDGTPCLNKWLAVDPATRTCRVERVTLLDGAGRPVQVLPSNAALKHHVLDQLIGDEPTFLVVESRRSDPETLTYRRPNVKQVYVLHNPHQVLRGQGPAEISPAYRPLFETRREADAIIFLTAAQRADAEAGLGHHRNFHVIPHPVRSVPAVPFADRDPNLVVMLARLEPQKRVANAIATFVEVVKEVPQARLEIYGHGPERAKLQRQIDRARIGDSVRLMGYTTDPIAVYQRAALSILTSTFEGFGLVLLESLSAGCPVVSYDVRYGPSDIITNGVNGFLVPPGQTRDLARRVVEVLQDDQLRRRLSDNAAALPADFGEEAFVARWSALFGDLDRAGWN